MARELIATQQTPCWLALGLLGCLAANVPAQQNQILPAQQRSPAKSFPSLWTVFGQPAVERMGKSSKAKEKSPPVAVERPQIEVPAEKTVRLPELPVSQPEPPTIDTSAFESAFSAVQSTRRRAILERRPVHETPATLTSAADAPPPKARLATPHWTRQSVAQTAHMSLANDRPAQPLAVSIAGEPLMEHVTVAQAVAKLDATLNVTPPATTPHLATAPSPEAAR